MAEERVWRGVDADLFRFTTGDLRDLYLAVMAAFDDAAVFAPALGLEQVRTRLGAVGWDEPTDEDALARALGSLVAWGLLDVTQDHAAHYATPEEFERKNLQWSLTRRGEAAIGGVLHTLAVLRQAVGLQPAILDAIADALGNLADLLVQPRTSATDAKISVRLADVENHLSALVVSVRQFNGHLQRLLREDATDDAVFADVKRRTVSYLDEYVEGVDRPHRRLALAIERVETLGLATLFEQALAGANLAPIAGSDPAPGWLADRRRRWDALRIWFSPVDGSAARITGLLDIARSAIIELLRVLERRWDNRRRSTSIANDFRRLAGWFAEAPGDPEAHQLFAAAFGLWPSRHAHLPAADGTARAVATPWTEAEPVEVAPALRTTGTLAQRGRLSPVADPSLVRAFRQRAQAEALAAHDELRTALETHGTVALSSFGRLEPAVFDELLALLAAGLDAPLGTDGNRRAMSVDGRVEIVLRPAAAGAMAALRTDRGVLHGPDFAVSISIVGGTAEDDRVEASGG